MKVRKDKFKYEGEQIKAILHMIGQAETVFGARPTTSDIASWMNVSKATARKHLNKMCNQGLLYVETKPYRKNATIHHWQLREHTHSNYLYGDYKSAYEVYVQRVLKVVLTDV